MKNGGPVSFWGPVASLGTRGFTLNRFSGNPLDYRLQRFTSEPSPSGLGTFLNPRVTRLQNPQIKKRTPFSESAQKTTLKPILYNFFIFCIRILLLPPFRILKSKKEHHFWNQRKKLPRNMVECKKRIFGVISPPDTTNSGKSQVNATQTSKSQSR